MDTVYTDFERPPAACDAVRGPSRNRRIWLMLAAVGVAVALPTSAFATCGDYVVIGNGPHASASHAGMDGSLAATGLQALSTSHRMEVDPAGARVLPLVPPCQSPQCRQSRQPLSIPPAPLITIPPAGKAPAFLADPHTGGAQDGAFVLSLESAEPRAGFPLRLDRPPRLAA